MKRWQIKMIEQYNEVFLRRMDSYAAAHGFQSREDISEAELRALVDDVTDKMRDEMKLDADMHAALKAVIVRSMFSAEKKSWTVIRTIGR